MYLSFTINKLFSSIPRTSCLCSMSKKAKNKGTDKGAPTDNEQSPFSIDKSHNVLIAILCKPGAKQNAVTEISPEGVSVQINAPPSEGEANIELIKYISAVLGLRKTDVTLHRGFKSRSKTLKVTSSLSVDEIKNKLHTELR